MPPKAGANRALYVAAAAAGVVLVALVVAVVVLLLKLRTAGGPNPVSPRRPAAASSLVEVFAGNPDREAARSHAADAEALFRALCELIEVDGAGGAEPILKTSGDVEDVRIVLRSLFLRGWSFARDYPAFGQVVGDRLHAVGDAATAPLDAARRRVWLDALGALADECRQAKEGG